MPDELSNGAGKFYYPSLIWSLILIEMPTNLLRGFCIALSRNVVTLWIFLKDEFSQALCHLVRSFVITVGPSHGIATIHFEIDCRLNVRNKK